MFSEQKGKASVLLGYAGEDARYQLETPNAHATEL